MQNGRGGVSIVRAVQFDIDLRFQKTGDIRRHACTQHEHGATATRGDLTSAVSCDGAECLASRKKMAECTATSAFTRSMQPRRLRKEKSTTQAEQHTHASGLCRQHAVLFTVACWLTTVAILYLEALIHARDGSRRRAESDVQAFVGKNAIGRGVGALHAPCKNHIQQVCSMPCIL